jgi:beta-phosphoglucomutase
LIINRLAYCLKAVVSGASKNEVETFIDKSFGKDKFNTIINGDDFEGRGKPDPDSFKAALTSLNVNTPASDAIVVENAPLGVKASNAANILV